MKLQNGTAIWVQSTVRRSRAFVAALAVAGLTACGDSPLAPDAHQASMQMSASAMTATTIGESLTVVATVVNGRGEVISNAGIHWDLSTPGVVEPSGNGKFRVLREGTVQVAAVWPRDPSVRSAVTITVNASIVASACITRSDQDVTGVQRKCAQQRVVVGIAPVATGTAVATSIQTRASRGRP